jgi:hypothetical protein
MPRFYFHISTIDDVFPDKEGVELDDLAAAHDCALRIVYRTMLCDPEELDWRGWMIKIADAKCRTCLTLLFPARKPIILLGLADSHWAAGSSLSCVKHSARIEGCRSGPINRQFTGRSP